MNDDEFQRELDRLGERISARERLAELDGLEERVSANIENADTRLAELDAYMTRWRTEAGAFLVARCNVSLRFYRAMHTVYRRLSIIFAAIAGAELGTAITLVITGNIKTADHLMQTIGIAAGGVGLTIAAYSFRLLRNQAARGIRDEQARLQELDEWE